MTCRKSKRFYNTILRDVMHEAYRACMFFFVCQRHLATKNPTSACSVWRNSENIIHTSLTSAYQIPTNSKSYQARNTKNKVVNFIGTKCPN